jgi:hypothetical protein
LEYNPYFIAFISIIIAGADISFNGATAFFSLLILVMGVLGLGLGC